MERIGFESRSPLTEALVWNIGVICIKTPTAIQIYMDKTKMVF